jgi:hypothetical protein
VNPNRRKRKYLPEGISLPGRNLLLLLFPEEIREKPSGSRGEKQTDFVKGLSEEDVVLGMRREKSSQPFKEEEKPVHLVI